MRDIDWGEYCRVRGGVVDNTGGVDKWILGYTIMLKDVKWLWGVREGG